MNTGVKQLIYLDPDRVKEIVNSLYVSLILEAYGETGVTTLRDVLETLHRLFQFIEPELIKGSLLVFKLLDRNASPIDLPGPLRFNNPQYLAQEYAADSTLHNSAIQICGNGDLLFWKDFNLGVARLHERAIVYSYRARQDIFFIRENQHIVPNPSPVYASIFSIPTFRLLRDALEDYKRRWIRTSRCRIFCTAWHGGESSLRLFFRNGPESTMRRSLVQFLDTVLGGIAEIRPEQVVDETHPVDIKVTWMFSNRLSLIEIKWLGKSINDEGKITQGFTDYRAREGAQQLADYLNTNYAEVPTHQTRGYLVVIDGRRRGLSNSSKSISLRNGFWYEDKEITYNPTFHLIREDFEEPVRMFAEPICRAD